MAVEVVVVMERWNVWRSCSGQQQSTGLARTAAEDKGRGGGRAAVGLQRRAVWLIEKGSFTVDQLSFGMSE